MMLPSNPGPIGVFDSGYGGLTILHGLRQTMPQYDYMYLGDNARAPYGSRSFEVVYKFTRQAVLKLFSMGCHLVILGCNTASAKALRSLQQRDIPELDPSRRVLGIIRPTAEVIGTITKSNHVGLLATEGTIKSQSYNMEISKLWPEIQVSGVACPLWAAIVEANEADSPGADYFVKKRIDQLMLKDADIDTIILGCTHYPLLMSSIVKNLPDGVRVVPQGQYVANSLKDYLNRHPQMEQMITKTGSCRYLTTESEDKFKESAQIFLHEQVEVTHVDLEQFIVNNLQLIVMQETRQNRISRLLQKELSLIFQSQTRMMHGVMVSVTKVRVSPDLSICTAYLSVFPSEKGEEILKNINANEKTIRFDLGKKVRNQLRIIPELRFFLDDSLDYLEHIDELLKK